MNVSDLLMQAVKAMGVECVFMVPGGGAMYLNDALRRSELGFVCNLHEQASAVAAEAYAKMTGNIGVCLVTTGPGSTNTITGLVGAWQDSTPVLFIAGQVKRADSSKKKNLRSYGVQEVDMIPMVRDFTKHAVVLDDPSTAKREIEKALFYLRDGRPGPVWIEVPLDIQSAEVDSTLPNLSVKAEDTSPPNKDIDKTIELLRKAKRPVVLVGNGVRLSGGEEECLRLIDKIGAPVLTTWASLDIVADDHPLSMGRPGAVAPRYSNFAVQNSDVVLAIGARLDLVLTAFSHQTFARNAKLILIDVDEHEIKKIQRSIDVAIHMDAKKFLTLMNKKLDQILMPSITEWWDICRRWKETYPVVSTEKIEKNNPLSVYAIAEILSQKSSQEHVYVCSSSGSAIEIFLHGLRLRQGQRVIHTTALGSMGFCLPSIVGTSTAGNNRPMIAIDGDGGFFFNVQELATISQLQSSVAILVLNNDGFSSIRNSQKYWFGGETIAADSSSGLVLPSICKVSESFGVRAQQIRDLDEFKACLPEILNPVGPKVYEILVDPDEQREPRVSSFTDDKGNFVSRPLEDMYPFLDRAILKDEMLIELLPQSEQE